MSVDLFRIVYCSQNSVGDDASQLDQILATSRRNNARCGVSGALLYSRGLFVQVLEGPFEAVQSVFERIQIDPRHDDVVVLEAENVGVRLFSEWAMAAAEPDDPAAAHALIDHAFVEPGSRASAALITLLQRVLGYAPA